MLPEKVLRDLADRLVRTEEELDTFRSKKEEQRQALLENEHQSAQLATERGQLAQEFAQLQVAAQRQQQALGEKEHQLARLAAERGQLAQEFAQLQATLQRHEHALADKDQQVNRITEHRDCLVRDVAELETALKFQREKAEEQQGQLDQLGLEQERLGQDVLRLQATVRDQREELANRDLQIIDLITQQDDSDHRLESMRINCQERESELTELRSDQKRLRQEVAILQTTVHHQRLALETVHSTFGWLLTKRLRPVKDKLLLPGSRRRQLYDHLIVVLKDRLRNGYGSHNEIHPVQFGSLVIGESENEPALAQPAGQNGTNGRPVFRAVPVRRTRAQPFAIYTSSLGNYFFLEFRDLLAAGFQSLGLQVDLRDERGGFSEVADWHLVVAPHEFFYLGAGRELFDQSLPSNLILFNTEQPSTQWYARARNYFSKAHGIWDLNHGASQDIVRAGFNCAYLPLGYLPGFKLFREVEELPNHYGTCFLNEKIRKGTSLRKRFVERPIDILFLGTLSARREKFFVHASRSLSNHFCYLHLPGAEGPLRVGLNTALDTKTSVGLAQRSKILLNIHRGADRYFEWHRIVMHGIWNRALVISEPCGDGPPFKAGVHFVEVPLNQIPDAVEYYLTSPQGQAEAESIIQKGYQVLREQCKLTDYLRPLLLGACRIHLPEGSNPSSRESVSLAWMAS